MMMRSASQEDSTQETFLDKLDDTIARLGDDSSGHPPPISSDAEESLIRTYAPTNLETPFQELYSMLYPCLRPRTSKQEDAMTASSIIMGPRGSGKSLLVDRCLAACQQAHGAKFRKVFVNGIVVRGDDVPTVVYEIVRQLSDIALQDNSSHAPLQQDEHDDNDPSAEEIPENKPRRGRKKRKQNQEEYLLRLRKSTFTSNLALLETTLKMAEVDRIPIVLILDELDAFILHSKDAQQHRQLLLYHLLDRVATPGSNLTLIGLTSNFTALTQMEKRIRSRAEGTSKIIYVRPPSSYEHLLAIVRDKLQLCPIQDQVIRMLTPNTTANTDDHATGAGDDENIQTRVIRTLQREFHMGRDVRWYCRLLSSALSLFRFDCLMNNAAMPSFSPSYLEEALAMVGSRCHSDIPEVSATKQSELCVVDGIAVDPRLQASLLDLTPVQSALVLSARRILAREAHLEQAIVLNDDTNETATLTIQRIMKEFKSFRRGIQSYEEAVLIKAAKQLLERGVFVPAMDHSGGGPLQYHISQSYLTLDPYSFSRLPLHLPVAIERELDEALRRDLLNCSTALKEWGRKTN